MGDRHESSKGAPEKHPPPDESQQKPTQIQSRTDKVCIGAVAWEHPDAENRFLSAADVSKTFQRLQEERELQATLILCSGVKVRLTKDHADDTHEVPATAASLIAKAAGCPVLVEWPQHPIKGAPHRWLVMTDEGVAVLRQGQHVFKAGPPRTKVARVLKELRNGYGWLQVITPTRQVHLALLICNEARIFDPVGNTRARLRHLWSRDDIPSAFHDSWIMLHPSHRPYWSPSKYSGFGLVGWWLPDRNTEPRPPLLSTLTRRRQMSNGQMRPPVEVIHAGPYRNGRDHQEENYAVASFRGGARRRGDVLAVKVDGVGEIRYAEFEV